MEKLGFGLGKYEGLPKAHQENFGNGQKWEDCAQKMGGYYLKGVGRGCAKIGRFEGVSMFGGGIVPLGGIGLIYGGFRRLYGVMVR